MSVTASGDLSFQCPLGFGWVLSLGDLLQVVVASAAGSDDLVVRGEVDGVVELAVSRPRQPVASGVAAGWLDRRGACIAVEMVSCREAGYVASVTEDFDREDIADPIDLGEACARLSDGVSASFAVVGKNAV